MCMGPLRDNIGRTVLNALIEIVNNSKQVDQARELYDKRMQKQL